MSEAQRPDMTVVGTYPSTQEAERARGHLVDAGIESVEIRRVSDDAFEIEVPWSRGEEATSSLLRMEQQDVRRFF